MRTEMGWRLATGGVLAACLFSLSSCTTAQLKGQSSSYAIIDVLEAASGATPKIFSNSLSSDVLTLVKQGVAGNQVVVPTVFEDLGRVTLHLALKDPGTPTAPTTPSSANTLTFVTYHVTYIRADGRNTPGVDVPYAFDGGLTVSISGTSSSTATFTLVRAQAKEEAPLKALAGSGGAIVISTIAEVTFYGTDQAGRAVSVTGRISVDFSDWGDPQ
jgi:hypothetical protein